MSNNNLLLIFFIFIGSVESLNAEVVYKGEDKHGRLHYSDRPFADAHPIKLSTNTNQATEDKMALLQSLASGRVTIQSIEERSDGLYIKGHTESLQAYNEFKGRIESNKLGYANETWDSRQFSLIDSKTKLIKMEFEVIISDKPKPRKPFPFPVMKPVTLSEADWIEKIRSVTPPTLGATITPLDSESIILEGKHNTANELSLLVVEIYKKGLGNANITKITSNHFAITVSRK